MSGTEEDRLVRYALNDIARVYAQVIEERDAARATLREVRERAEIGSSADAREICALLDRGQA